MCLFPTLPRHDSLTARSSPSPRVTTSEGPIGRSERKLRVLLVEDSLVIQKIIQRLLEKNGFTVVPAHNGREALTTLETERFDVVLMDVQMPYMNGYQATSAIRKKEVSTGRRVPIIAITAQASNGEGKQFLEAGMDGYLAKPMTAHQLATAITRVVPDIETEPTTPEIDKVENRIDVAAIMERLDDDGELLRHIIRMFIDDLPSQLSRIRSAVAEGNCGELEKAAHSLKGSVGNFHAKSVSDALLRLETFARERNLIEAKDALSRLESEFEWFEPALISLRSDLKV